MKIAITGTRGIPNRYGGFEQFAGHISARLAQRGHNVRVYNPVFHTYHADELNRVRIIRKYNPENLAGPSANYLYDYLCLKDAIKRNADIILECGYASAAPAYRFLNFRNSKIITHVDGLEWTRSKWSSITRKLIKRSEKTAVRLSHALVCDHPEIQSYFEKTYGVKPWYIPYGAGIFKEPDAGILGKYMLTPNNYYLVIARLEPENNLQAIIKGFLKAECNDKLLVVGDRDTSFGRKLVNESGASKNIIFLNAIYDQNILNNLRHFSKLYFHGHSAGGTNPSLLEAMAAGSLIVAHDNKFNRYVLKDNALYFNNEDDIQTILSSEKDLLKEKVKMIRKNIKAIEENYQWQQVTDLYEDLFLGVLGK